MLRPSPGLPSTPPFPPPSLARPPVAFLNICKAATPAATLIIGLALGIETLSKPALFSTILIAVGVAIATMAEAATGAQRGAACLLAGETGCVCWAGG